MLYHWAKAPPCFENTCASTRKLYWNLLNFTQRLVMAFAAYLNHEIYPSVCFHGFMDLQGVIFPSLLFPPLPLLSTETKNTTPYTLCFIPTNRIWGLFWASVREEGRKITFVKLKPLHPWIQESKRTVWWIHSLNTTRFLSARLLHKVQTWFPPENERLI